MFCRPHQRCNLTLYCLINNDISQNGLLVCWEDEHNIDCLNIAEFHSTMDPD